MVEFGSEGTDCPCGVQVSGLGNVVSVVPVDRVGDIVVEVGPKKNSGKVGSVGVGLGCDVGCQVAKLVVDDSCHFDFEAITLGSTFGACEQIMLGRTGGTAAEDAGAVTAREFIEY